MLTSRSDSRSVFGDGSEDNTEVNSIQSEQAFVSQVVSPNKAAPTSADTFSRELTRLQEEQVVYVKKIEKEKQRQEELEEYIQDARLRLRLIRDKTKNGNIVKDNEIMNKKLIGRLEYQLQMSKIKLSTAKKENGSLKARVEDLRREKLLHVQIMNDLAKEVGNARRRTKFCQKEIVTVNEKKHKVKLSITAVKQKMVRDMEDFSSELTKAKQNINSTQANIMNTIREKLQQTSLMDSFHEDSSNQDRSSTDFDSQQQLAKTGAHQSLKGATQNLADLDFTWATPLQRPHTRQGTSYGRRLFSRAQTTRQQHRPTTSAAATAGNHHPGDRSAVIGHNVHEAELVLKETEFSSVEELLLALQTSEDRVFALYNETQSKHEEVEKMESENKYLESKVQEQMKKLHELEGNQERVKQELEKNIEYFQSMITKYDADYQRNLEILNGMEEHLMNLLKNVAVDEAALDQQLLSTGITDRNIHEYLGLIEQRIDDLIQMSKAASHQSLRKEDFLKLTQAEKVSGFQMPVPPTIMETEEEDELLMGPGTNEGEATKLQPLNIPVLKEIMNKKVQKMSLLPVYINPTNLSKTNTAMNSSKIKVGGQSTTSLKSVESNNE